MDAALASDEPVVVSSLTTSTRIVTAMPEEGVFKAEISPRPVRVQDPQNGEWAAVDNTLVREGDAIRPLRPATAMSFGAGGEAPFVSIFKDDASLSLSWPGPLPEPELVGSAAVYRSVVPDVDLVAKAGTVGFSTYLVVRTPEAAEHPMVRQFSFDVDTQGVELADRASGAMVAANPAGESIFGASPPMMWEAASDTGQSQPLADATAEEAAVGAALTAPAEANHARMAVDATGDRIEITPPVGVLEDPNTQWPVVLDPGWYAKRSDGDISAWTMLQSAGTTNYWQHPDEDARVGYDGFSSTTKDARSYFKVEIASLHGRRIHQADFVHKQIHSPTWDCNATTYGPGVQVGLTSAPSQYTTWAGAPSWWQAGRYDTDYNVTPHEAKCTPGHFINQKWNITGSIQDKVAEGAASVWIGMKSAGEGNEDGWRKYDNSGSNPYLYVMYSTYPDAPRELAIDGAKNRAADGWWSSDGTPKLQARVTSPNGGGAKVRFEVFQGSTEKWQGETGVYPNNTLVDVEVGPLPPILDTRFGYAATESVAAVKVFS